MSKKDKKVLVGICGGIACYKAAELVRSLRKQGYSVTCLMTKEAACFITPLTLQHLSGNKVFIDLFKPAENIEPAHISLAEWAGKIVIIPATCHIIAKLAAGLCDDIVSLTVLSSSAPVLICPAMHEKMYKKEVTAKNIAVLKKRGFKFAGPVKGELLNGKKAMGRLENLDIILKRIKSL